MNLEFIKSQNLGSLLLKSSQSNSDLRLLGSYLVRSYLITTVISVAKPTVIYFNFHVMLQPIQMLLTMQQLANKLKKPLHSGVCSTRPGSGTSLLLYLSLTSVIVIEYTKEGLKH